jgi:hypothetical protein
MTWTCPARRIAAMRNIRRAVAWALVALVTAAGSVETASAATELVVRDSHVARVFVLGDSLVYMRAGPRGGRLRRAWMRKVGGRVSEAEGVPDQAWASAIGRDRAGRVVVTMVDTTYRGGWRVDADWWLYDVARDRSRRLRGLPDGRCAPSAVSVWRKRLAYAANYCPRGRSGLFLRVAGRTRRLARGEWAEPLALRGDALSAVGYIAVAGEDAAVYRLVEDDVTCRTQIAGSYLPEEWGHVGPWLVPGHVLWWVVPHAPGDALVGAQLDGHCGEPGPTGTFELVAPVPRLARDRAVDGRWLYYADDHGIRRQRLPARAITDPPRNDDFERAEWLTGSPPMSVALTIGNATKQPGEPGLYERSIWYALRPAMTRTVGIASGAEQIGVFTGTELPSLTIIAGSSKGGLSFAATAGATYWISLSCSGFACYLPTVLRIR